MRRNLIFAAAFLACLILISFQGVPAAADAPQVGEGENMATRFFTPKENAVRELPDRRLVQVATAGVPMPWADAVRWGLVSAEEAAGEIGNAGVSAAMAAAQPTIRREGESDAEFRARSEAFTPQALPGVSTGTNLASGTATTGADAGLAAAQTSAGGGRLITGEEADKLTDPQAAADAQPSNPPRGAGRGDAPESQPQAASQPAQGDGSATDGTSGQASTTREHDAQSGASATDAGARGQADAGGTTATARATGAGTRNTTRRTTTRRG